MSALLASESLRDRRLHALGIERLRWRRPIVCVPAVEPPAAVASAPASVAAPAMRSSSRVRRLALQTDSVERSDPAINKMYMALTEAVSKAGLQPVRVCDVADDANAAVMVFGAALVPEGIPAVRILRVDPLAVLHADRERKRRLWEQLLALGNGGSD
ncbi:MAG: hypothetical protein ACREPY_03775 [Rhodanobacteraceae bacterium]